MAAKALGAVDLSHNVLNLDRLQGDVLGQGIVHTTSSRHGERVLRDRAGIEIVPDVRTPEQELRVSVRRPCRQLKRGPNLYVNSVSLILVLA